MILVVDDHDDTRDVLVRTLILEGYVAASAASGAEALKFLQTNKPSLVILDFNLPDMTGLMVFAEMRKEARLLDIPVIMFSAATDTEKEKALQAGINSYVVKGSMDWSILRREILRLAGPPPNGRKLPKVPDSRQKDAG